MIRGGAAMPKSYRAIANQAVRWNVHETSVDFFAPFWLYMSQMTCYIKTQIECNFERLTLERNLPRNGQMVFGCIAAKTCTHHIEPTEKKKRREGRQRTPSDRPK
jgi:hypothetical protein